MRSTLSGSVKKQHQDETVIQQNQFLLISMINIILLTIQITLSNICFLIVFITSSLKFYKTYIMQKHVDIIEIPPLNTSTKTSIIIYCVSRAIHHILTNKSLLGNLVYVACVIVGYLVMKVVPLFVLLMIIVDLEYAYCLYKRWNKSQIQTNNTNPPSQFTQQQNPSSSTSNNLTQNTSFTYFSNSLKPTRSTFTQQNSDSDHNFTQISQSPKNSNLKMNMIEQEIQQEKLLDEELPQISTINIDSTQSAIHLT